MTAWVLPKGSTLVVIGVYLGAWPLAAFGLGMQIEQAIYLSLTTRRRHERHLS